LDAANNRLYVNRCEAGKSQVVALDADGGDVVARFPQGGQPSPDPQRDRVYITDRGVTVYNRNGDLLGRLQHHFTDESPFIPNPYAFKTVVNPVTEALLV